MDTIEPVLANTPRLRQACTKLNYSFQKIVLEYAKIEAKEKGFGVKIRTYPKNGKITMTLTTGKKKQDKQPELQFDEANCREAESRQADEDFKDNLRLGYVPQ
jgi:hypothetical protein